MLDSFLLALVSMFVLAIASNATPFFGASYTLFATAVLISFGYSPEGYLIVVLVTALGATLGKIIIYTGGWGLRKKLQRNKNIRLFGNWLGRRAFYVGLFVTAIIPALPLDDYVFIGAGANNAKLFPMLGVTLLAKIAKSAFEIAIELKGISVISGLSGLSRLDLSIILSVVFIVIGIVLYKLDWTVLIKKVRGKNTEKSLK